MGNDLYTPISPAGVQSITATSSTAARFTIAAASAASATQPSPNYAIFTIETTDARYRDDGTAPTATTGVLIPKNVPFYYDGNVNAIQFCATAAQSVIWGALYRAGP